MPYSMLIVDDSPAMRRVVRRAIEISGMDVGCFLEAGNGGEALKLLHQQPVNAVLTDLNMPVMDGEQLVICIQQDESLRTIPVVMISTDSTDLRIHRLLSMGARGYITKPFAPERLREELERVLDRAA